MVVLAVEHVVLRYGGRIAVGPCSFTLHAGEVVALVGQSGVGKTTLLRALAGLVRPSSGRVLLHGQPASPANGAIALVFQHGALFPWRTALQNVAYPLQVAGIARPQRAYRARAALEQVGLAASAHLYPAQLSGGMRQRVALARALVGRPALMLLDEPMAALDGITRAALQAHVGALFAAARCPVLLVTHDLDEAVRLAGRVLVMAGQPGRIVGACAVDPAHPDATLAAVRRLLAAHYTLAPSLEAGLT